MPIFDQAQLWPDSNTDLLYLVAGKSISGTDSDSSEVWTFDVNNTQWDTATAKVPSGGLLKPFAAGGTFVPELEKGFLLGGQAAQGSGTTNLPDNLVEFDAGTLTWTNQSASGPSGGNPRAFAQLFYLPAGKDGVLVLLGGASSTPTALTYVSKVMANLSRSIF